MKLKSYIKVKTQKVKLDEHGRIEIGLDDRRVLDGRGLAPTLRHLIEKYDPNHRPWRNFLYKEYNSTFDFWKRTGNVELHLVYPDKHEDYENLVKKWKEKQHTYTKDLFLIFNHTANKWDAYIRDEKNENGFVLFEIPPSSVLKKALGEVTSTNCSAFDRRCLEEIILKEQTFTHSKTSKYYFYRDRANFYRWTEKNTQLKISGVVVYLNELERIHYLVQTNKEGKLAYVHSQQIVDTPEDTSHKTEHFIYTIDLQGNLFIAKEGTYNGDANRRIQHPSFTSGARIIAAGAIKVKDGKITYIDNASGHYMPGEFSLMKAVLEFKKHNLLAENCVVDFVTMNKNDERYYSGDGNRNSVEKFLEISQHAFMSVIVPESTKSLNTENEKEETTSSKNEAKTEKQEIYEGPSEENFENLWKKTELGKLSLQTKQEVTVNCDFFFDNVNAYIKNQVLTANLKNVRMVSNLREIWLNILENLCKNCTSKDSSMSYEVASNLILTFVEKLDEKSEFKKFIIAELNKMKELKNISCFFSNKKILVNTNAYQLQVYELNLKNEEKENTQIKKISRYALFTLTNSQTKEDNLLTPNELEKFEKLSVSPNNA